MKAQNDTKHQESSQVLQGFGPEGWALARHRHLEEKFSRKDSLKSRHLNATNGIPSAT